MLLLFFYCLYLCVSYVILNSLELFCFALKSGSVSVSCIQLNQYVRCSQDKLPKYACYEIISIARDMAKEKLGVKVLSHPHINLQVLKKVEMHNTCTPSLGGGMYVCKGLATPLSVAHHMILLFKH